MGALTLWDDRTTALTWPEKACLGSLDSQVTPLYIAAQSGHAEVVVTLLMGKAALNHTTDVGTSPLYIAAQENHVEAVCPLASICFSCFLFVDNNGGESYMPALAFLPYLHLIPEEGHSDPRPLEPRVEPPLMRSPPRGPSRCRSV